MNIQEQDFNIIDSFDNDLLLTHCYHGLVQELPNGFFPIDLRESLFIDFLELARKRKPSGRKQERRTCKLPNQIRHDQNAAIAVGTWKKRGKPKD